jgi:tetratricopeptide (TPR) repeat protein
MSERYQEALSLAPNDPQVHMGLGNVLAAKGYHQQAIEEYERVLAVEPTNHQAVYRMGMVYRSMGDIPKATQLLQRALQLNPGEPGPYIDLANISFARGDFEQAKQLLEAAAELNPSNFRIYVNIGAQLGSIAEEHPELGTKERNEWRAEALKYLRYAVWLNPSSAEARYNLGGVLFNARKLDEAIFHLSEAVRLSPSNRDFQEALRLAQQVKAAGGGQ